MTKLFPGVILSGGRSSRMGQPKALLPFGDARLIDHVANRLRPQTASLAVNANDPSIQLEGAPVFADRHPDFPGPLAGICASLAYVGALPDPKATHIAIVTVDTPFFPRDLFARLAAAIEDPNEVVLAASGGWMHPVTGLWPLSALPDLEAWLENPPTLRVRAFVEGRPHGVVHFAPQPTAAGEIDPFFNINTPEDLEVARLHLGHAAGAMR